MYPVESYREDGKQNHKSCLKPLLTCLFSPARFFGSVHKVRWLALVPGRTLVILLVFMACSFVIPSYLQTSSEQQFWYSDLLSSGVFAAAQLSESSSVQSSPVSGPDVQVTFDLAPQNEPSLSINPVDPMNIVAGSNDFSLGQAWLGAHVSLDGGLFWTNDMIPRTGVLAGFDAASDPVVAFSRNGTLYYVGLAFNIHPNRVEDGSVFIARSTDGGISFDRTVMIAIGSNQVFNDKPWLTVDNTGGTFDGRIYVSWTQFTSTSAMIMVSYSRDGGQTFSLPRTVSTSQVNQGSALAVGPTGELYVVWRNFVTRSIMFSKSPNSGETFTPPRTVSSITPIPVLPGSSFRNNTNPALAVDSQSGNVYVGWNDYRNGNADVIISKSLDNGTNWSTPLKVNDDVTSNDQFFPALSSSNGTLHVIFYDRREDPNNSLIDVYYARSVDGGAGFEPNVRVTEVSSNPDRGFGGRFIGDYIGIASHSSRVHVAWTDTRNALPGSLDNQDIFADRLSRPPVITPIPSQIADEESLLNFTVEVDDPDGDVLTFDCLCPDGARVDPFTGEFTWRPDEADGPENITATVIVSDGVSSPSENFDITVNEVNTAPFLVVSENYVVDEGITLIFDVEAFDADVPENKVVLSVSDLPEGADFDVITGNFTWTPSEVQGPGNYTLVFTVTDDGKPTRSSTVQVIVHVDEVNLPPAISVSMSLIVDEETNLAFRAMGSDPDALGQEVQDLTFSLGPDAPGGASISSGGFFSWTPSEDQGPADYRFDVIVSDGLVETSETITVVVNEVDRPPVLTVPGTLSVDEGFLLIFFVDTEDPDLDPDGQPANTITLSVSDLPQGAIFDPDTGAFYWTPSNDQGPGVYTLVFTATEDGGLLSDTQTVVVTVVEPSRPASPLSEFAGLSFLLWGSLGVVVVAFLAMLVRASRRSRGSQHEF